MTNEQTNEAPQYVVTGLTWSSVTRKHDTLTEVTFEQRKDATCFMNVNREWIKGMVLDRNAAAVALDKRAAEELSGY